MVAIPNNLETLLNEHDVARITGLSVASVRRWRLLRLEWSPFLRQTVKTHFSSKGELSHGVTQAVHAGI